MSDPLVVLLTNDDGIEAPGIQALEAAFLELQHVEVWIVAPDSERSTCSHGMSLTRPVFAQEVGPLKFAVDGLPVDCVYLAMYGLMPRKPDIVISGINAGANLGSDVIYSGTVAGARQAALQGVHGIASSLVAGRDYRAAARITRQIALELGVLQTKEASLLNLNFPGGSFTGPRFAPLGAREYPRVVTKRIAPLTGETYYWLGGPPVSSRRIEGTDTWLIEHGIASATSLSVDQTAVDEMRELTQKIPLIAPIEE